QSWHTRHYAYEFGYQKNPHYYGGVTWRTTGVGMVYYASGNYQTIDNGSVKCEEFSLGNSLSRKPTHGHRSRPYLEKIYSRSGNGRNESSPQYCFVELSELPNLFEIAMRRE